MGKTNNFHQKRPSSAEVREGLAIPYGAAQIHAAKVKAQAMQQQMFVNMYLPLVVQLAEYRVDRGYEVEGGLPEPSSPDRVAEEAWSYADAAMKRLLVEVEKPKST